MNQTFILLVGLSIFSCSNINPNASEILSILSCVLFETGLPDKITENFSLTLRSLKMEMTPRPEPRLNSLSLNPMEASLAVLESVLLALGAKRI